MTDEPRFGLGLGAAKSRGEKQLVLNTIRSHDISVITPIIVTLYIESQYYALCLTS